MSLAISPSLPRDVASTILEDSLVSIVDTLDVPQAALFLARDVFDPRRPGGWYVATRGQDAPSHAYFEGKTRPTPELDAADQPGEGPRVSIRMPEWIRGRYAALVVPIRSSTDGSLLGLLYLARGPRMSYGKPTRDAAGRAAMRIGRALERASALRVAKETGRREAWNRGAAGDLSNALSAIVLLSELLEDDRRVPWDVQRDLRMIRVAATRAGMVLHESGDDADREELRLFGDGLER